MSGAFLTIFYVLLFISTVHSHGKRNGLPVKTECHGCIALDKYSFHKIVPHFKAALIKFDIVTPWGPYHDQFTLFGDQHNNISDLIVAEVGVKNFADYENYDFFQSLGLSYNKLPITQIWSYGEYLDTFSGGFGVENFRQFVISNTGVMLPKPGCIEALDNIAQTFVINPTDELIKQAQVIAAEIDYHQRDYAYIYINMMKKIKSFGTNYLKKEKSRLFHILKEARLNSTTKAEMQYRLNILYSFKMTKDEL